MSSSATATPPLQSFDPHAVHYFTSAAASSRPSYTHAGLPRAAYPTHVLVASTSPMSRAQPPKNNSVPSQSTPHLQTSSIPIQSPRPIVQSKGFAVGGGGGGGGASLARTHRSAGGAIFEPFSHKRSITPELDDVLKKKAAPWGQWELEQSFQSQSK